MTDDRWKAWRPGVFTNRQSEILAKGQHFDELMTERDALAERVEKLELALRECAGRFERCLIHTGTSAEYVAIAVKPYRAALARPSTPPTDGAA